MTASYFIGERLTVPNLRFNPSSIAASHPNARQGLRTYGPYDSQRLGKDKISAALIYPCSLKSVSQIVQQGLIQGNGSFRGFQSLFRIPIDFIAARCAKNETENDFKRELRAVLKEDRPDIIVFLTSKRNQNLYSAIKAESLGNGIPSQVLTAQKLGVQNQIQWTLENIALQIYAKIGGTPWTVMSSSPRDELVLGVSRALDRQRNFVVGFVTLFTYDGDYQFLYSLSPKPTEWSKLDEYRDALANLIVEAFEEYTQQQGNPTSLVIHICKRPGKYREIAAVEKALQKIGNNMTYALVHLNDDSNYRLFDTLHPTYVPESGIKVNLSSRSALLLLDGRPPDVQGGIRQKRGVPCILEVTMDHRSTMPIDQFSRLVQQVFEFSRVNWRGFNAQAIPATLNYSYLVARLVAEIGAWNWNAIVSAGILRDKAWFL
jgi:argonaute-like protein implicated in RNA metabolism and viral defense